MDTEIKEIQGDDPKYNKRADELLGKVVRGEIRTYVLVALDDGDVGTIINLESTKLKDYLKLDGAIARVVAELRNGVNCHLISMAREQDLLSKAMALHLAGMDEALLDGLKSAAKAMAIKTEGGAE